MRNTPIDDIFQGDKRLAAISATSQQLHQLNQLVNPLLPENLQAHCQVANYREGKLILLVDNPIWLTPLHYAKADILQRLRTISALARMNNIQGIVDYQRVNQLHEVPNNPPVLSANAADLLQQSARLTQHKPLASILEKLSRHRQ